MNEVVDGKSCSSVEVYCIYDDEALVEMVSTAGIDRG